MPRLLLVFLTLISLSTAAHAADKPNILYIMSDDHCAQAIGAYGGRLADLNAVRLA